MKTQPNGDAERLEWSQSPEARSQMTDNNHKHVTPNVTVDIIIINPNTGNLVLIKRKNAPLGWALPGGFVDVGETTMQAAVREATEETGCRLTRMEQFHTYSDPMRDPRNHNITVTYIGYSLDKPVAADDAAEAAYFNTRDLKGRCVGEFDHVVEPHEIVFDHMQMIVDLKHYLDTGQRPTRE